MQIRNCLLITIALAFVSCSDKIQSNAPVTENKLHNKVSLYEKKSSTFAELVSRGEYIVKGPASCGFCHGDGKADGDLVGGNKLSNGVSTFIAPALKDNPNIANWSDERLIQTIRTGYREGDSDIPKAMHGGYRWMSDQDIRAVISYLRPKRVPQELEKLEDFQPRGLLNKSFEGADSRFEGYVPQIPRAASIQYGRYLSFHVARCQICHSPGLPLLDDETAFAGADFKQGGIVSTLGSVLKDGISISSAEQADPKDSAVNFPGKGPNIRGGNGGGISDWDEQDIVSYLTDGRNKAGRQISYEDCPWDFYNKMTTDDRLAIARYLKSL